MTYHRQPVKPEPLEASNPFLFHLFQNKKTVENYRFGEGPYENFTQIFRTPLAYRGKEPTAADFAWGCTEHWRSLEYSLIHGKKHAMDRRREPVEGPVSDSVQTFTGGLLYFLSILPGPVEIGLAVLKGRGTHLIRQSVLNDAGTEKDQLQYEYFSDVGLWIGKKEDAK